MLSQSDLKRIATARLTDAKILFNHRRYDSAAYLCGYAIELSLKLRICKTLKWIGFPELNNEFKGLQSFKTHNLDDLLRLSGIEAKIKTTYLADWSVVRTWDSESRYKRIGTVSETDADNLILATAKLLPLL